MSTVTQCRDLRNAPDIHNRSRSDALNAGHIARNKAWEARRELQSLDLSKREAELKLSLVSGGGRLAKVVVDALTVAAAAERISRLEVQIAHQLDLIAEAENQIIVADELAQRALELAEFTKAEPDQFDC